MKTATPIYTIPKTVYSIFYICALLATLTLFVETSHAVPPVSARYTSISGDTVRLQLTINSPSPQSLILEQHFPPGTQILSTSPAARQVNGRSGVIKWLFKGLATGTIEVSIRVSPAGAAKSVNGTLRYRLPGDGGMTELHIPR